MEKLILDIAKKGYLVSFNADNGKVHISVKPQTGMGHSLTIDEKANWLDALKAIEMKLFY